MIQLNLFSLHITQPQVFYNSKIKWTKNSASGLHSCASDTGFIEDTKLDRAGKESQHPSVSRIIKLVITASSNLLRTSEKSSYFIFSTAL